MTHHDITTRIEPDTVDDLSVEAAEVFAAFEHEVAYLSRCVFDSEDESPTPLERVAFLARLTASRFTELADRADPSTQSYWTARR